MKIFALTDEEKNAIEENKSFISELFNPDTPINAEKVQVLYDSALVGSKEITIGIGLLGVAFGELMLNKLPDFEWAKISDEYGEEICLCARSFILICSPISMMSKRIEDRESIDIADLADKTCQVLVEKINSSKLDKR